MNFPRKKILLAGVAALGLSACSDTQQRASDIVNGYIGENDPTGDIAYREGTPVPNTDGACDTTQPVFDPTTGLPIAIIDPRIVSSARDNGDELVILCDETKSGTDAGFGLEDDQIPTS